MLGGSIAAASLLVAAVPFRAEGPARPALWWILLGVMGGPAVALGLERLQARLVRRPQPFTQPDLVAADDAITAQSVHSGSGSGMAVELVWLSALSFTLAQPDARLLRWTLWLPGFLGLAAAVGACQYYGHRAWRVRRPLPRSGERAAPA